MLFNQIAFLVEKHHSNRVIEASDAEELHSQCVRYLRLRGVSAEPYRRSSFLYLRDRGAELPIAAEQALTSGFVPDRTQSLILDALDGKALTLAKLERAAERSRKTLIKALKELNKAGLVKNCRRIGGYYRPDAPPPRVAPYLKPRTP
jgi:hypothetical protein